MSSYQSSSIQPYSRKDKVAALDALRRDQVSGTNVIIRKFTLPKGKFGTEDRSEDKSVPTMAATSQVVVKEEGKKSFDTSKTSVNQRCITVKKVEAPQSTVESVKMQEVSESNVRSIVSPPGSKAVPVILSKATRLGLVGGKLVILQPMEEQQQPYVINVPNTTVYKKMKLTPPDQSDSDEIEVLAVKPPLSSTQTTTTADIKKPSAVLTSPPKLINAEAILSKDSPSKSCQFKLEASGNSSKGCYLVPFGNVNHSNKGEMLRLSTSPQNEVKVIKTSTGNQLLVKKNIECEVGTSAEPVLNNSVPKKAVVLASGLKTAQPILKLTDAPENLPPGAKTFKFPANNISGEKTNGTIKYVTLPGHMLPKLPPGTKVYTTSAISQQNAAGTTVPTLTAENIKVLATPAPKPVPETPAVQQSKTPANTIELKVEVDEKGDVVDVTPARSLPKENVNTEKPKGAVHGSWALLQKRCDRAMELKKKVLQKDRCQSKVRRIPSRIVTEVDRGTQTSFFSLVEPGRLVEIQLEDERLSEARSVNDKSSGERVASEGTSTADDDLEPPERKKAKTSKPLTVYDVLVQHNIQTMSEKTTGINYEMSQRCKLSKIRKSGPPLVHPSCAPPKVKNPDFASLLDSPSTTLNTPEMRHQLMEDFVSCVQRDNCGNIPLHVAVYYEKLPLVKRHCALLTARKASLDIHNDDTETPLHMAVLLRNIEIIQVLLSFGAKVSVPNGMGNSAVHLAILEGNDQVLNTLLSYSKEDFPLDSFNDEGLAPLHLCAQADKVEEAKALLNEGAEIDLKDAKSGRTPLFHAVERNAVNLVKMLLELGANPNLPNFSGHTALLAANEFCDNPVPLTNDPLFMTPKLRPLNAEDGPVVAALVGLASDMDTQTYRQKEQMIEQRSAYR